MTSVGKPIDRVDGRNKVTGTATYAAEVGVTNVAHAVIVGSTIARGRIRSIDVRAARDAAGVLGVLTHDNAPRFTALNPKPGTNTRVVQALQDAVVHYADQPIALVVADTLEHAQYAAALVAARYDSEPATSDLSRELANAYVPAKAGPRGEPSSKHGDVDAGLRAAAAKVDATYTTPVHTHNPMEPHATIAAWRGPDHLTLYDSTQGIFNVRDRIADVFGLRKQDVRVINHFLGGGFGCKGSPWSHVILATMAAKVVGRPVKLVITRQQMAAMVGHRPTTIQRLALAADARGKLTAIRHEVISETSRFDEFVEPSALQTRMLYASPAIATSHSLVKLDVGTPTFTRAPGEASGSFALESAMDELAVALGIDPVELRIRNHATTDPESGKPWSSKSLLECYKRGAETFGWAKRTAKPRSMRDRDGHLIGWGMATATYPARQMPASAVAKLRADGSYLVQAGTQDIGTGTYTIMTQIAADELGVPVERVTFELGDTQFPETPLSAGSFTASSTGSAVKLAARALRDKLEADPGARARGAELVAEYHCDPKKERDDYSIHGFGAVFAEVRVDELLGEIRVTRLVGAYGCGKILNPKTAHSQLEGGLVWSIGMALMEETVRDRRTARPVTRDLADYHVPTHADVPAIEVITVDEVDHYVNELGAKGLGEIGNVGGAAAIANAVFHATGVRVRDLPIRLDKVIAFKGKAR